MEFASVQSTDLQRRLTRLEKRLKVVRTDRALLRHKYPNPSREIEGKILQLDSDEAKLEFALDELQDDQQSYFVELSALASTGEPLEALQNLSQSWSEPASAAHFAVEPGFIDNSLETRNDGPNDLLPWDDTQADTFQPENMDFDISYMLFFTREFFARNRTT